MVGTASRGGSASRRVQRVTAIKRLPDDSHSSGNGVQAPGCDHFRAANLAWTFSNTDRETIGLCDPLMTRPANTKYPQ